MPGASSFRACSTTDTRASIADFGLSRTCTDLAVVVTKGADAAT
eukprot:CAMPEP_0196666612 /NCGR_PEP_ID=MMETSP1086-20130531/64612_1 /TAXON_ID=77921 /ORGANISM="Cyanoptyche  gloeocystis , Strain SAG4.97" /LENGTH=43 /DNA_ID= /DNA_START= /DNA_END= /DNA_ORIENTATION=